MQNRSSGNYSIHYDPIELLSDFPLFELGTYSPPLETENAMGYHQCLEIGYCYEGYGVFFVRDKVFPFSSGDVCIVFKNEIHNAISSNLSLSNWKFIMLDPVMLLSGMDIKEPCVVKAIEKGSNSFCSIVKCDDPSGIPLLIKEIFKELDQKNENYRLMIKSLVFSLAVKLSRIPEIAVVDDMQEVAGHNLMRIAPALNYVSENYMKPINVSKLARLCDLSVPHFRRLFKASVNLPPNDYIHMVRIKLASMMLLKSDCSVLEVSLDTGFLSITSFNRQFKKLMGTSPREWKKAMKR